MATLKATDLQFILNTTPLLEWQLTYKLDTTFMDRVGGLVPGKAHQELLLHYAGNSSAASFAESQDISSGGKQSRRRVKQEYARCFVTFGVDNMQKAKAEMSGLDGINDLLQDEANAAIGDLLDEINTQSLSDGTGNSAKDINGVQFQVADDNTWFGLDRTTATYAASYVNDNGGTPRTLTDLLMRDVHNTLMNTRRKNYTAIWTSSAMRDVYEDLIGDKKRFVNVMVGDIATPFLAFKGRPIFEIPGYADRMDFVNEPDFKLEYLPQKAQPKVGRENVGPFAVEPLAVNTDDTKFYACIYLNLLCKNPWGQGSLQDIE